MAVAGCYKFRVSLVDARGRISSETIDAPHPEAAGAMLASRGTVIECMQLGISEPQSLPQRLLNFTRPNTKFDTVSFSLDMATLLEAGVSVKEAIGVLHRKETQSGHLRTLGEVAAAISHGQPLSVALKQCGAFSELLIATVAASEQTGDLATGLSRYARHQQSLQQVRDRVVGACVYPLLLMVVGSLVVALLLGVVVPRFATLIDSTGKELPLLSKVLMGWGAFVDQNPWVGLFLFGFIMFMVVFVYSQLKNPQTLRSLLRRIPGVAKVMREFQHLQMYRTTAILTARGISIHKALGYSSEYLDSQDRQRLQSAQQAMVNGISVSEALGQSGLCDAVATSMINVAERTGSMPEMLDRIADFYERTLQRNIDIVSRLIEPILMIIFGIVIGGIVVLMYLPIFDLASSIS